MRRTIAAVLISVVFLAACGNDGTAGGNSPEPPSDRYDGIQAGLRDMADAGRFSGAVAIAKDGETVYADAFGLADRERQIPNDPDTRFNIASIGKTFTAVAIVQLAQKGLVDLDQPVGEYVSGLPREIGKRVTIHHLLTHTSGLHDFFADPRYRRRQQLLTSVSAYRPFIEADRPEFEPGSRFLYSNSGYVLLGMVVEEVSGMDFYDYVEENVFVPAGMDDTAYLAHHDGSNRAAGYMMAGGKLRPNTRSLPARGSPAGGAYSTVGDLLRFVDALYGYRLLDREHTEMVTSSQVKSPDGDYGYGFGIRQGRPGEPPTVGHNGGAPGVGAELAVNPGLGYTVVVLGNLDYATITPAVDLILNSLEIP